MSQRAHECVCVRAHECVSVCACVGLSVRARVCVCACLSVRARVCVRACVRARAPHLPLRVVVLHQGSGVGPGEDHQTAVLPGDALHSRPGAHDLIHGAEGEVVQVLVQRVAGRLLPWV